MYSGWICPVCGRRNFSASVCGTCGFDDSRDYEKYPTLSPIPSGTPSVETLRRLRQIEQSFDRTSAQHSAPPSNLAERLDAIEKKFDALTTKLDTVLQSSQGETSVEPPSVQKVMPSKAKIISSVKCGKNVTWTLDDKETLTISGTGEMWNYSHDELKKIPWCAQRKQIQRVVMENGVTTIGDWAFSGCTSLSSGTIPDSVSKIGKYAFYECTNLISVTIGDGVTEIGYMAFYGCANLNSVTIPSSITTISGSAFEKCKSLKSVSIPAKAELGNFAFPKNTTVTRR